MGTLSSKTLIVNFVGDTKNLEQSVKRSTDSLNAFGKAGNALKNVAGYAVATAGIYGMAEAVRSVVTSTVSFQSSMTRIQTQAGASAEQVKKLSAGVLGLAGQVGVAPTTLADGMYHVVSSLNKTIPAAQQVSTELRVLKVAAEGARVGGANLVDVTNALDAAVVSGIPGTQNFQKAMGALNATVGAGDMTMQQLADAFGTGLLGPMATFGVKLQDISAALAVFGDNNIRGQDAATKLASAVRIMAAPSKAAAGALSTIGLSSLQLANDIRTNGLVSAFVDLKTHLKDAGDTGSKAAAVITAAFGGKQSTGVDLLLGHIERLKAAYEQVGKGAHSFAGDVTATNATASQQFAKLGAELQSLGIQIGDAVLPLVTKMVPAIQAALSWVGKLFSQFKSGAGLGGQLEGVLTDVGQAISSAITPIIKALEPELQATFTLFTNLFDLFTSQFTGSDTSSGVTAAKTAFTDLGTAISVMIAPIIAVENALSSLLGWLKQNQTVLAAVEGAIGGVVAAFVAWKVAAVASTAITVATTIATEAFAVAQGVLQLAILATREPLLAVAVAQGVLNAAMDANPALLIITALGVLGGILVAVEAKTHFLEAAWAAIKPAFQAVANWVTTAAGNVASAVSGAWDSIKTKTTAVFNSVMSFLRAWWPELLGVFTFGIGTVVGLVIQNWGSIKSTTENVWKSISGSITGAISEAAGAVHVTVGALTGWLSTAWGNIKSGVSSFASSIKTGVLDGIQGAINAVISFLDGIIKVLNDLPFVSIKRINPIQLTGGSSGGSSNTPMPGAALPGHYQGGKVSQPMYMVGEEAPKHPEYVLATNPAYRQRNVGLWQQAGGALGMPGFAKGGIPGYAEGGAVSSTSGPASGVEFVREMGSYLMGNGLTKIAAAGALGNMGRESSWNTGSIGTGGAGAIGWTPPTKIPGWNGSTSGPWNSMTVQENLLWNGSAAAGAGLRNFASGMNSSSTVAGATEYFEETMENAGIVAMSDRIDFAQQAYDILNGVKGSTGGGGILGAIGSVLGSIPSAIGGVATSLLSDGAKALVGELPNVSKLPSWLQGLGGSLLGDATSFLKNKASSLLSSINPFGGSGGSGNGGAGSYPAGVPAPMSGAYRDPATAGPEGLSSYDGLPVAKWIVPELQYAAAHGWSGSITSGYRPGNDPGTATGGIGEHAGLQYPHGAVDFGGPGPLDTPSGRNRAAFFAATAGYKGFPLIPEQFPPYPQYPQGDAGHASGTGHYRGGIIPGFAQGGVIGNAGHLQAYKAAEKKRAAATKKAKAGRKQPAPIKATPWHRPFTGGTGIGGNGPLPFNDSDLNTLDSMLSGIFALDGGSTGIGVGPDGDTAKLSALVSTNTGNWSDDTLFPPPNFGSISDPTQFVVIPDPLPDGTQPAAYLSPNIAGVSSELGSVIGWEQSWVGDLQQTAALSQKMAKPIETAITRRVDQIAKIRKRVEANLKKIKALNDRISNNQATMARLAKTSPPFANPKNKSQRERNQQWQSQMAGTRSQLSSQITALKGQIAPLESENMALTGSKTTMGTKGELATISAQLGVPGSSGSALAQAEGGSGTSASGLYGLQGTVAGWLSPITSPGGDLDQQQTALAVYKTQLSNLGPGAQAALTAANNASSTTSLTDTSSTAATSTTATSASDTLASQAQDQMIAALSLRARSAEALLAAEIPTPGFAKGGIPFGGWFGTGGDITASQPTLIGIGDGPGTETASIRRQGQGGMDDGIHVHNHFAPGMEFLSDLITTTVEQRERGQVRQAIRRLPGGGGGSVIRR